MTAIFAVVIVVALIQAATYGHGVPPANRGFHLSSGAILIAVIGLFFVSTTLFAGLGAWIASMVSTATSNPLGALATVSGLWIMFFMGISQIPGETLNAYTGRPFGSPASCSSSWSARSWPA